jgi:hypothetical protein
MLTPPPRYVPFLFALPPFRVSPVSIFTVAATREGAVPGKRSLAGSLPAALLASYRTFGSPSRGGNQGLNTPGNKLRLIFAIFLVARCSYAGLAYAIVSVQFDLMNVPESPTKSFRVFMKQQKPDDDLVRSPGMWSDSLWRGMPTV